MVAVDDQEPFFPFSPLLLSYDVCSSERDDQLQAEGRNIDFPSVFQFVAEHTICRLAKVYVRTSSVLFLHELPCGNVHLVMKTFL